MSVNSVAHGQKSHGFVRRLVAPGFAREERPGRLHHGRYFHVHHKRLYALIGQATIAIGGARRAAG